MNERPRFDPVGWFVSTAMAVFFGSIALAVAGQVLARVWPWLLAFAALGVAGVLFLRFLVRLWQAGRQPW